MKKYIPNFLTGTRTLVALIIPFIFFNKHYYLLLTLFLFAITSDLIDGYLARTWNVTSVTGKALDMIGDKLLAFSSILILTAVIDKSLLLLLIGEVSISMIMVYFFISSDALKNMNFSKHESSEYGKIKTSFLFITLAIAFISYKYTKLEFVMKPLVIITFISQLITIFNYIKLYKKVRI